MPLAETFQVTAVNSSWPAVSTADRASGNRTAPRISCRLSDGSGSAGGWGESEFDIFIFTGRIPGHIGLACHSSELYPDDPGYQSLVIGNPRDKSTSPRGPACRTMQPSRVLNLSGLTSSCSRVAARRTIPTTPNERAAGDSTAAAILNSTGESCSCSELRTQFEGHNSDHSGSFQ